MRNENKEEEKTIEMIRQKAKIFHQQNTSIHVSLKNKTFYNGFITDSIRQDYFLIEDRILGTLPVFFIEVYDIEPQVANKKGGEK